MGQPIVRVMLYQPNNSQLTIFEGSKCHWNFCWRNCMSWLLTGLVTEPSSGLTTLCVGQKLFNYLDLFGLLSVSRINSFYCLETVKINWTGPTLASIRLTYLPCSAMLCSPPRTIILKKTMNQILLHLKTDKMNLELAKTRKGQEEDEGARLMVLEK